MKRIALSILVVVAFGSYFLVAEGPRTPVQYAQDLGSPVFAVRDTATKELWKLGEPARAALEEAAKSEDLEVAERASEILTKFNWGIYPDTPADVLKQIREFRSGEVAQQTAATDELLSLGGPGIETLSKILTRDFPNDNRLAIFGNLLRESRQRVPVLIVQEQFERAEKILELGLHGPLAPAWLDYTSFMQLRDKGKAAISKLETLRKVEGMRGQSATMALAMAYHIGGRSPEALRLLDKLPADVNIALMASCIREDAGMWAELAKAEDDARPGVNRLGVNLFIYRKAGNKAKVAELIAEAKDVDADAALAGMALLMNEQSLDGIEVWKSKNAVPNLVADCLATRMEFAGVLDLIGQGAAAKALDTDPTAVRQRLFYNMRRARYLSQLGRKDESIQTFNAVATEITKSDSYGVRELIRAEVRAGRLDLAAEHAGKFLAEFAAEGNEFYAKPDPFEMIFEDDAPAANGMWKAHHPVELKDHDPGKVMRQIRTILAGKATLAQRKEMANKVAAWRDTEEAAGDKILAEQTLAALARLDGQFNDAEAHYRATVSSEEKDARTSYNGPRTWVFDTDERFRTHLDFGDFLMERGRHKDAAKAYYDGWLRFPNNPILLYQSGRALLAAGDKTEGHRIIVQSHWVPLGNAQMRGRFLDFLSMRGQRADLKRERDVTRMSIWYWERMRGNVWGQFVRSSTILNDYDRAAIATERNLYFMMKTPGMSYVEGAGYISVPMSTKGLRARESLRKGSRTEAFREAKEVLAVMPGHVEFLTAIVPEFEHDGKKDEAESLFRSVWAAYRKVIADYPESAWAYHSAALAAAGCQRELDTALTYAKKAVALEPDVRNYTETLAEVHFRRGEREAAVRLLQPIATLDHRSAYYKRLLERYQRGDIHSVMPAGPEGD